MFAFHSFFRRTEWTCRVYAEQMFKNGSCDGVDIDEIYRALLELDPPSYLALFAKGAHLWHDHNFIESRDALNQAVMLKPGLFRAWILLGEINSRLYCWDEAENSAIHAHNLLKNDNDDKLMRRIDLILVEAMANSSNENKLYQAVEGCQEVRNRFTSVIFVSCGNRIIRFCCLYESLP